MVFTPLNFVLLLTDSQFYNLQVISSKISNGMKMLIIISKNVKFLKWVFLKFEIFFCNLLLVVNKVLQNFRPVAFFIADTLIIRPFNLDSVLKSQIIIWFTIAVLYYRKSKLLLLWLSSTHTHTHKKLKLKQNGIKQHKNTNYVYLLFNKQSSLGCFHIFMNSICNSIIITMLMISFVFNYYFILFLHF